MTRSSAWPAAWRIAERAVERFRVLNGLGPGDHVSAGDKVKIVVE